jgi:hypothetical protein
VFYALQIGLGMAFHPDIEAIFNGRFTLLVPIGYNIVFADANMEAMMSDSDGSSGRRIADYILADSKERSLPVRRSAACIVNHPRAFFI